jgi:nitrite reductase (NADH) small subunit
VVTALDADVRRLTLGPVEQIPPGEGRTFTVGTAQVAVFRLRDGTVRALDAVCPHRGGPLADGQTDAQVVLCPLHLNAFELSTGRCLTGGPDTRAYPVAVDDDHSIVISLPTGSNST